MLRITGVILIAAVAVSPVAAAVYKCTGNDGEVTYQDTPCRGGAAEIEVTIVDDRAYDPPPSAQMQRATEELRRKDRELTERLERGREERALREAQRPPPRYGSGSRFPPLLTPSAYPYAGGVGGLRWGFTFPPRAAFHPPSMSPGALPQFNCLACPLSRPLLARHARAQSHTFATAAGRRAGNARLRGVAVIER